MTLGGDHTVALPLLRELHGRVGEPLALVHFDAHLDTWDSYISAPCTHGTHFVAPSKKACLPRTPAGIASSRFVRPPRAGGGR